MFFKILCACVYLFNDFFSLSLVHWCEVLLNIVKILALKITSYYLMIIYLLPTDYNALISKAVFV